MAKSKERLQARRLRKQGLSIGEISNKVDASRSTISLWCRDIELANKQRQRLIKRAHDGAEKGRQKWARIQKKRRIVKIERLKKAGIKEIGKMSNREFFLAGVALYWAEGFKSHASRFGFINSDPSMILFMLEWMKKTFNLTTRDFTASVGINIAHKRRVKEVERYWLKLTGIPPEQFRKPSFKKYKLKKKYENFDKHFGTLRITPKSGTAKLRKTLGWIEGLGNQIGAVRIRVRRRSSVVRAGGS